MQTLPSLLLQTCLIYQHGVVNVGVTGIAIILAISQLLLAAMTISLTTMVLSTRAVGVATGASKAMADEESGQSAVVKVSSGVVSLSWLCQPTSWDKTMTSGVSDATVECGHHCVITTVRSACLLWCRIVAVGVFMTEFHVWTLIVFGVHWCIALLWLVLQDSASESGLKTPSPAVSLFRRALVAYLLVFDWPARYQSPQQATKNSAGSASATPVETSVIKSAGSWLDVIGIGGPPRSVAMAVYYGVSSVENAAMLSLWFHFGPVSELVPAVSRLTTLASCTAAFTLGVLCVVASTQGLDDQQQQQQAPQSPPSSLISVSSVYDDRHDFHNPPNYSKVNPHATLPAPSSTISTIDAGLVCPALPPRETLRTVVEVHRNTKPVHGGQGVARSAAAVVARLTKSALSVANHQHNPADAASTHVNGTTQMWERISVGDDESSNSRNTNTLEGALMGSGSGSGLGLTLVDSCPSPLPSNLVGDTKTTLAELVASSTWHRQQASSPYRDPSTFTGSRSSFSALAALKSNHDCLGPVLVSSTPTAMVKRPYVCCPRSSTPKRLTRRNSSCSSLPSVNLKAVAAPGISKASHRPKKASRRHQQQPQPPHASRHCRRRGTCHCRIFDFEPEPSVGLGIFIKENAEKVASSSLRFSSAAKSSAKTRATTLASSSLGRLSQGFETEPHRQFQILCASCLGGHDPLLTSCSRCHDQGEANNVKDTAQVKSLTTSRRRHDVAPLSQAAHMKSRTLPALRKSQTQHHHPSHLTAVGSTVSVCSNDYPSDTEITCPPASDSSCSSSSSSSESSESQSDATYTTWPPTLRVPTMERLLSQNDPSPWNYVNAWLANANHAGHSKTKARLMMPSTATSHCSANVVTAAAGVTISKRRLRAAALAAQISQVRAPTSKHVHQHQPQRPVAATAATNLGVEDIYASYCTVPPRLGKSIKELSLIRTFAQAASAAAQVQYASPAAEIVV